MRSGSAQWFRGRARSLWDAICCNPTVRAFYPQFDLSISSSRPAVAFVNPRLRPSCRVSWCRRCHSRRTSTVVLPVPAFFSSLRRASGCRVRCRVSLDPDAGHVACRGFPFSRPFERGWGALFPTFLACTAPFFAPTCAPRPSCGVTGTLVLFQFACSREINQRTLAALVERRRASARGPSAI